MSCLMNESVRYHTENFFRVKVTQKLSHVVPILTHIRRVTLTHLKKRVSLTHKKRIRVNQNEK